jgi:hypothetical protein
MHQCAKGIEYGVPDSLGPHVVPHPKQEPPEEQGIHEYGEQDEYDWNRHRRKRDDYGCCPHADLPPACRRRRQAGETLDTTKVGPSGAHRL